jgi:hypothetical protein
MQRILLLICLITVAVLPLTAQNKTPQKLLRHVVLSSFKEGSTPEQIKTVTDAFAELPKKIKQIKSFEWGTNNSPESRDLPIAFL